MNKKKLVRAASLLVCGVMTLSLAATATACSGKTKTGIVIMTEELSGLFNPFYATTGADQDVVGMTQIGMLSTDSNGNTVAGDDYPTVVKAYSVVENTAANETVYNFVIKNGLKFSDGVPLTMNDVMFNIYEYLDPVYTGSSTMYSIDIKGLSQYRTQTNYSAGGSEAESNISSSASSYAQERILTLVDLFESAGLIQGTTNSYSLDYAGMVEAISTYEIPDGYKNAVATPAQQATMTEDDYRAKLKEDYDFTLDTFKEELNSDYIAALESYDTTTAPYKDWTSKLSNDVFKFFLYEGYIKPVYAKVQGKEDKTKIESFDGESIIKNYDTKEKAIERVYNDTIKASLNDILTAWGTAGTLATKYAADAREVIMKSNLTDGETLLYPNISGIESLGHTTSVSKVTINGVDYKVAHDHNDDGTTTASDEYDVLRITINGTDPKAIYNFGFTVAPVHYYTADSEYPNGRTVDIKSNKFGVEWSSSNFQSKVIQSKEHVEIPVGAGAYVATDRLNSDNPTIEGFTEANYVYFKANHNFMFDVKTENVSFKVVSSTNALDSLESGEVDYVTPQFTKANSQRLKTMADKGYVSLDSWQLGYGYIGINAGKVPDVNIRRAIMAAMNTSLAIDYYEAGTCNTINWPMSSVSWAYPWENKDDSQSKQNGHDYTQWSATTDAEAEAKVQKYMDAAGVKAGDSSLSITFTIAGSSITEHPTYAVFLNAQRILNNLGWNVEIKADSQALTKLSTGSLEVWAAAWGSTIDPDMYQVYHKNSTATSVYAWGYREIKSNKSLYSYENGIIDKLSDIIEDARSTNNQALRKDYYETAMGYVLDLAIELPVYQRKNLYAYNSNTVKGFPTTVNEYSSPLEKIWELELV